MAQTVDWNEIKKQKKVVKDTIEYNGVKKLIPMEGKVYRVRPLGQLYKYLKYMVKDTNGKWRFAICENQDTCPVANKHNERPREQYVINILDREDGQMKVLQANLSTFMPLVEFYKQTGKRPGKTDGAEFELCKSGTKLVMCLIGSHKLSIEDMEMVKEKGLYNLAELYKATDPDKIEEVLFSDRMGTNSSVKTVTKVEVEDRITESSNKALADLF